LHYAPDGGLQERGKREMRRLGWGERGGIRRLLGGLLVLLSLGGPAQGLAQGDEELFSPYLGKTRGLAELQAQAAEALARLQTLAPADPTYRAETVRTGVLLVKSGRHADAVALLEPSRPLAQFTLLHALGVAYLRTHRNQDAYDTLLRAHQLQPTVAGPLLPAALACARMPRTCDDSRLLVQEYLALGGRFTRLADRIRYHVPYRLRK